MSHTKLAALLICSASLLATSCDKSASDASTVASMKPETKVGILCWGQGWKKKPQNVNYPAFTLFYDFVRAKTKSGLPSDAEGNKMLDEGTFPLQTGTYNPVTKVWQADLEVPAGMKRYEQTRPAPEYSDKDFNRFEISVKTLGWQIQVIEGVTEASKYLGFGELKAAYEGEDGTAKELSDEEGQMKCIGTVVAYVLPPGSTTPRQ